MACVPEWMKSKGDDCQFRLNVMMTPYIGEDDPIDTEWNSCIRPLKPTREWHNCRAVHTPFGNWWIPSSLRWRRPWHQAVSARSPNYLEPFNEKESGHVNNWLMIKLRRAKGRVRASVRLKAMAITCGKACGQWWRVGRGGQCYAMWKAECNWHGRPRNEEIGYMHAGEERQGGEGGKGNVMDITTCIFCMPCPKRFSKNFPIFRKGLPQFRMYSACSRPDYSLWPLWHRLCCLCTHPQRIVVCSCRPPLSPVYRRQPRQNQNWLPRGVPLIRLQVGQMQQPNNNKKRTWWVASMRLCLRGQVVHV